MASSPARQAAFGWGEVAIVQTAKELVLPGPLAPSDPDEQSQDQTRDPRTATTLSSSRALASGDLAAFAELFETHGRRMKSIAANLLGSTADAEDAVQDTFLKVHRAAAGFRGASQLSTWIFRILINTCYDQMRRNTRRAEDPLPPRLLTPAGSDSDHPLRLALQAEVSRLPQQERAAFLLCEVEGFSHREAGEILEVPEATSRTFLFRAKRRLQQALRPPTAAANAEASS